ncbi:MAG: hypothetical protein KA314_11930 [Chloroflexi bacterium]|nr:hypothetical protein [Chloroflexota bacterium]MBP8056543.1 hypothetical protein [Chloroflexota bacterium]
MSEPIGEEVIQRLMHHLVAIEAGTMSCEEAFFLLDEYADLVCCQQQVALLMPVVHQHLELCPGCREFYESLLNMVETAEGASRD